MAEQYTGDSVAELFRDGVVDVFNEVVRLHEGPRVIRTDAGVRILRMQDVLEVTKRRDVRSMDPEVARLTSAFMGAGRPLIPLMLDGEEHTKYRRLLDPLFSPKEVARLEPQVRALCEELIDGFVDDGEVELFTRYCEPLPSQVFLTLLGLPLEDMEFLQWFKDGIIRPRDEEHRASANSKMIEYIEREHTRRAALADPGDDLFGGFMKADVEGHRLTREDVVDIVFLLVMAGLDTVSASLSCIVDWLARHPDRRQELLDEPSRWPAAIEELMRVQTPVAGGGRYAAADFEIGDEQIKRGESIGIVWAAANMDPEVFAEPTEVRFDRDVNRHIAFASGFHRCLGSHLARMELRVALEVLHARVPDYVLHPGRPVGYNNVAIRTVNPLPLLFDGGQPPGRTGRPG